MEQPLKPLERLGRELANAQDDALRDAPMDEVRARLLRRAMPPARFSQASAWRVRAASAAVVVAIAAAVLIFVLRPRPLSFHVGASEGTIGAWIAPSGASMPVTFSDGTSLALDPDSRARVVSVDRNGARILLERGRAHASVVHTPRARWDVVAGPFDVHVTGTRFDVDWDPAREILRVHLVEGSVVVSGSILGDGRPVKTGETLQVFVRDGHQELASGELPADASAAIVMPADASAAIVIPATPAPTESNAAVLAPSVKATAPAAAPAWRALVTGGKYKDAVTAAEAEGFTSVCNQASASDLLSLGDAARFAGNGSRATEAFLALRRRFPGDPRAASAAFSLGRVAFDQRKAFGEAGKWFDTYLAEQPAGTFAREAAGRLIEARKASGDVAGARAASTAYLAKYPQGPHAQLAKSIVAE